MTYNVLNYSGNDATKEASLRIVIEAADPDIIIVEEIISQSGFNDFLSDVLNYTTPGLYAGASFTDQSETNTDIGLYYKPDQFSFVSTYRINTSDIWGRRDVIEFVMLHYTSGVEFRVYGCHLKAGTASADENERTAEATVLRDYLNSLDPETPFIMAGDLNLYDNAEGAFQVLIESQDDNDGQCFDPVNRIGDWHDNPAFADVHTQSPRGGNFGGMDDRFDWLLASQSVLDENDMNYIEDTYTPYGNDGNHFNVAINDGNNSAVSATVADALVNGSDHLPVYMDINFNDIPESDAKIVISEIMPNPSQVGDSYGEWIELYNNDTVQHSLQDWIIKDMGTDEHIIAEELLILPGEYLVIGRNNDESVNGGVSVDYVATSFILSNTADELILFDDLGNRVDEVPYTSAFPFGNGISMHIVDMNSDNMLAENWTASTTTYGAGDFGTPGFSWYDSLNATGFEMPESYSITLAYPNPFNGQVNWTINQLKHTQCRISIINLKGNQVETVWSGLLEAGQHTFSWKPKNQASGVYFIEIAYKDQINYRKMIYMK